MTLNAPHPFASRMECSPEKGEGLPFDAKLGNRAIAGPSRVSVKK